MNDKLLTYRYPRTLAEAASRYPCDAKDAVALHGPYRKPLVTDDRIAIVAVIVCLASIIAGAIRGVV